MTSRRWYALGFALLLALAAIPAGRVWSAPQPDSRLSHSVASGPAEVRISEIRIDQSGDDDPDEYFELAGEAETSLDGLTYLVIGDGDGGSGVIEAVVALSGESIPASGYFVAAQDTFTLGTADLETPLNFENSDNVTHMLVRDFTGVDGDDLDTNDDGTLDLTPWAEVVDRIALVEEENPPENTEYHYGPPSVGPDGNFVPGHVYLCEDGWKIGAFGGGDDTPGAESDCAPDVVGACGDPATPIHEIQGMNGTSPLTDTLQTIEAIVVGDFQNNEAEDDGNLNGFFVQEDPEDADADPATSDGLFIFAPDAEDVSEGRLVRVTGTVEENETSGGSSMTQLSNISPVLDCGEAVLPPLVDVTLPLDSLDFMERYEGMRVRFPQTLQISEYFNFDRFNEVVLVQPMEGEDRLHQPTAIHEPGSAEFEARLDYNLRSRITLDDGRTSQNSDPAIHPNGQEFDLTNLFRGGDIVSNTIGVIEDSFALYRIQPTEAPSFASRNPRPEEPEDVGGTLKVASFNVLNYFVTLTSEGDICGPNSDQECRGADTPEELERQRTKIIAAIAEIDADIVGLIEIENHADDAAVTDLVAGLNEAMGEGTYAHINTGPYGTDVIKQAFIYKPASVTPVGDEQLLDSTVDPRFLDEYNRPALAQTFEEVGTGERLTVIVNHLKSKGSDCNAVGDPDTGDGQGNCNVTRTEAAAALVDWLAGDPTGSGDPDFLIIGDLNAYDKEDPIDTVRAGADDAPGTGDDYTDLILQYQGEYAYSYVFDGQLGYLDHGLANQSLATQVTGATIWTINADEPDLLDYDMSFKQPAQEALWEPNEFRSSDHDPVVVGLDLGPANYELRLPMIVLGAPPAP